MGIGPSEQGSSRPAVTQHKRPSACRDESVDLAAINPGCPSHLKSAKLACFNQIVGFGFLAADQVAEIVERVHTIEVAGERVSMNGFPFFRVRSESEVAKMLARTAARSFKKRTCSNVC